MPRLSTSKVSEDEPSNRGSENDSVISGIPKKRNLQQKASNAKRKRTTTSELPATKKCRSRRDHMIPARARLAFQIQQDASEADPGSSDNFYSAAELQSEEEGNLTASPVCFRTRTRRPLEPDIPASQGSNRSLPAKISRGVVKKTVRRSIFENVPSPSGPHQKETVPTNRKHAQDRRDSPSSSNTGMYQKPVEMPVIISRLSVLEHTYLPKNPAKFTKKQLMSMLGGTKFANHLYTVGKARMKEVKGYYLIDSPQPFAPSHPGQHGALVVSYMLQWDNLPPGIYQNELPLFVNDGNGLYTYFGQYLEPRSSDIISFNEMASIIPDSLKEWYAKELSYKVQGRKRKVAIMALKGQWPMTPVGWWDENSKSMEPYDKEEGFERGPPYSMPISDEEAEAITYEEILQAFERPDFGDQPCFRLFWDYLECVGFDKELYKSFKRAAK